MDQLQAWQDEPFDAEELLAEFLNDLDLPHQENQSDVNGVRATTEQQRSGRRKTAE